MQSPARPSFGKRTSSGVAPRRVIVAAAPDRPIADHAAFFAAARQEVEPPDTRGKIVPRSFRAALLAGLVIGFCLAGLDITKTATVDPALDPLLKMSGMPISLDGAIGQALPYLIALSLLTGARTAATTLLIAHRLLAWRGHSSHLAYALGGAAMAAIYAALVAALGHPSHHGWLIDVAAGAGAGFFYRMFAGAKRV